MALYTIADPHLSLSKHKPMDIFGSRWQDHTDRLTKGWTAVVDEDDTVLVGGDISWGISLDEAVPDLALIDSLPGKKIFLRGNHDYWWNTLQKNNEYLAANGLTTIDFLQNNAHICEDFVICGTRGWYNDPGVAPKEADYKKIVTREAIRLEFSLKAGSGIADGREMLAFFHFPPYYGDYICKELIELLHAYGVKRAYFGHIHGQYRIPPSAEFEGIRFTVTSSDYLSFVPLRIFPDS
ncbi:MAG: metallophosphoesterase [Eubacteriales bacterium]